MAKCAFPHLDNKGFRNILENRGARTLPRTINVSFEDGLHDFARLLGQLLRRNRTEYVDWYEWWCWCLMVIWWWWRLGGNVYFVGIGFQGSILTLPSTVARMLHTYVLCTSNVHKLTAAYLSTAYFLRLILQVSYVKVYVIHTHLSRDIPGYLQSSIVISVSVPWLLPLFW